MTQPMAVVADTNLFVAAGFNEGSASRRIVEALRDGRLLQMWNEATRRETVGVIERIPPLEADDVEGLFSEEGRYGEPLSEEGLALIEDVSDRKFAALARACEAVLITSDSDFLAVRDDLDMEVVTPSEFVGRRDGVDHMSNEEAGSRR